MPAAVELDMAAIVAPIPGDNPGGARMPFLVRQKLENARKEFEPNPDDPSAPPVPRKPEWNLIVRTASETLSTTSKDLETALRLLEALTRLSGFAGATLGFQTLTRLVENCWDYLHPIPDPEDGEGPEIRAERFNWIGDLNAGANFPSTLRQVKFLLAGGQECSLQDRLDSMQNRGAVSSDDMSRATLKNDAVAGEIEAMHQAFFDLDRALTEKLGNNAPGMIGLRNAIEELHEVARRLSKGDSAERGSEAAESSDGAANSGAPRSSAGVPMNLGSIGTREDAYRMIGQIADQLERIEPHSPIPDLLRRAVELGRMPFRRLIRELVQDGGHLTQIYREFGIKDDGT